MTIKILSMITLITLLPCICGCVTLLAAGAGGAGTAMWLSGKLSGEIDASYDNTVEAAKDALASLDMSISKIEMGDNVTQIMSTYTDGSKTWIDVRPITKNKSKVEIRVGIRGDKEASNKIFDMIKKHI